MRQTRQIELLERLVGLEQNEPWNVAPASMRNPASVYTDPGRFADERRVLFRGRPQFVGLSGECSQPGGFITGEFGGVPIAVIRQRDGSLRAVVNACRHRGATLLEGSGTGDMRRIVCPYHGWSYDMDGRLLQRPAAGDGFDDLTVSCDLHHRAVAEKHGMIFVHPTETKPFDVDQVLCGAEGELADYELGGYVHVETRTNTWKINWKLILDTFTEAYHIRFLHQKTIAPYFLCDLIFDGFGLNPRTVALRKDGLAQLKELPREAWKLLPYSTTQYFLVPNGLLVYQLDHVEVWRLMPIDAGTTHVSTSLFAPEPPRDDKAVAYWTKNLNILLKVIETEDFPLMEGIQKNLASGAMPEVVYGKIEPALVYLHSQINAALASGRS